MSDTALTIYVALLAFGLGGGFVFLVIHGAEERRRKRIQTLQPIQKPYEMMMQGARPLPGEYGSLEHSARVAEENKAKAIGAYNEIKAKRVAEFQGQGGAPYFETQIYGNAPAPRRPDWNPEDGIIVQGKHVKPSPGIEAGDWTDEFEKEIASHDTRLFDDPHAQETAAQRAAREPNMAQAIMTAEEARRSAQDAMNVGFPELNDEERTTIFVAEAMEGFRIMPLRSLLHAAQRERDRLASKPAHLVAESIRLTDITLALEAYERWKLSRILNVGFKPGTAPQLD